ncbi:uncharacterized protein LOC113358205 isoform X3 [Papaver somniferum]|uniref:uncharacterized protein LOC113358205 isoform X3 n=1 Tax=Papaver somniferum TaxID=3469 RepID=UPI000E6F4E74|nr:uncharacterized protein LOC113358205 isoform X3 [Papaver somniferum]
MRNQESPIVLSVSQTQNFPSLLKPVVRSLSLLPVIRRFLFHGYLDHHVNLGDVLHDLQICFGFQGRSVANFFGTKNKLQVYDVTNFSEEHPGRQDVQLESAAENVLAWLSQSC